MEKVHTGKCPQEVWFGILISFALCFVLFSFDHSTSLSVDVVVNEKENPIRVLNISRTKDPCSDRYIYIHDSLPARFNDEFINNCESLSAGTSMTNVPNMCPHLVNLGLGPKINNSDGVLSNASWFVTNPYLLEVIFHNRMKKYECLTRNSTLASAIYVPFYPSMDVGVHLWDSNIEIRDSSAKEFVKWLSGQPEWTKMWGRDHFFASGRISWDFRRERDNSSNWGSKLRFLPESLNMTMLSIEGSRWKNDIAIPYPTNFHPSNDSEVVQWQDKPAGDSFTRRSTFDAFLAGCIPVFFHPATAYTQYLWYLPKNHSKYSVYIPVRDVTDLKEGSIEKILLGISKDRELAMREEVIKLIPKLVYADPRSRLETEDAFDIAVQGILERIGNVSKEIREGRDPSIGFADEDNSKVTFPKTIEKPT
ncbi:probable xyloglucan galactosyltransferase GT14 isoform X2 [Pyrus communis]|uniref:probable xyloglucan galactosyltransferase GT14 isoform X2 n=1 Tax=Pyrus communis TaxID=23211 RepID=UPI0035C09605